MDIASKGGGKKGGDWFEGRGGRRLDTTYARRYDVNLVVLLVVGPLRTTHVGTTLRMVHALFGGIYSSIY